MEKENVGVFSIVYVEGNDKYFILYTENGEEIVLDIDGFDSYDAAVDYKNSHLDELNQMVTDYKAFLNDDGDSSDDDNKTEENDDEFENDKPKKNRKGLVGALALLLAVIMLIIGSSHIIRAILNANMDDSSDDLTTEDATLSGDSVKDEPEDTETILNEVLTKEEFEELTTKFVKIYNDKQLNASTQDLIKFVSIINIDKLVEDNPKLASELFANQSKEEYLNDAAKIIGMTYTYNRNVYMETGSTQDFIRISQSVSGEQRAVLEVIEAYVDLIATYSYDAEEANIVISQFIAELGDPTSGLSYLDDGVGFGMQVYIELIRSCIAKDIISQRNLDALSLLTNSSEYVSNIFTVYDKCNSSYTKTK